MNHGLFLSCLADPTRFAILRELALGERCVNDLVTALGQSQSNISHHLRLLRDCGLVAFSRVGRENHYRIGHAETAAAVAAVERASAAVACGREACA